MLGRRRLGCQGLEVSEIGLGCMGMSQSYGHPDDRESVATIHDALELGCDFFDTAESYGPFVNEELLGRALRGRRHQATVATKFGWDFGDGRRGALNSRPEHIRAVVDQSLHRLGTDHLDVLYQHRVDLEVPIEDVAGTVGELVDRGKVRFFGLSEAGASTIRRAHATFPVSVVQTEFSLWERHVEAEILPTLRELGIGMVAYSPLGRGFLTGTARRAEEYPEHDYRRHDPRFQGENFDANTAATDVVRALAAERGVTPAQLALAWVLHQGTDVVPIPGTKRRSTLKQNLGAARFRLTSAESEALARSLQQVAGSRYPEHVMHMNER